MKTLKFLVIVVTFLDGDICGHFVGVQSAPCSGLSPPSCSLSVSTTSQPQCLNQFSPRSTRSPNTKGQSKCSSEPGIISIFSNRLKKQVSCFGNTQSVIVLHWIKRLHEKSRRPPKRAKFLFAELSFPQFGQYKPIEKTAWEITAVQFCSIFR